MRDGPARGRRPLLRRARHEGLRRGLGAGAARRRANGLPSRLARGLPAAAERRVGPRRLPPHGPAATRRGQGVVEAAFAHRRKTLANSLSLAGRRVARGSRRGARRDRPRPRVRAEALAPAEFVGARGGARVVSGPAPAKINLALVVGPTRDDGKHEVVTVFQRIDLFDRSRVEPAREHRRRRASPADTIVRRALEAARRAARLARPRSRSASRSPRASAAAAPTRRPRSASRTSCSTSRSQPAELHALARGARRRRPVLPRAGPQLGTGDGTTLEPLELPQDYTVVLAPPHGARKESTGAVYGRFDERRRRGIRRARREPAARAGRRSGAARPRRPAAERSRARRRSPASSAGAERSAPTSAAPAPPSTGCSSDRRGRAAARRAASARGASGCTDPAWYV